MRNFCIVVLTFVVSGVVLLSIGYYFFNDVFAPEKVVRKSIIYDEVHLEWYSMLGILDQNFPDVVTIQINGQLDTICRARNMANVEIYNNYITIGFYGEPEYLYKTDMAKPVDYMIAIDTSYVK